MSTAFRRAPSHVSKFVRFRRRIGFGGGNQIGTKIVAGEQIAAAAIEPFVAPTGTMNGSIVGEVTYAIQNKDPNGIKVALESYPGAVRQVWGTQLLEVGAAGVTRLIGKIFGV